MRLAGSLGLFSANDADDTDKCRMRGGGELSATSASSVDSWYSPQNADECHVALIARLNAKPIEQG